MSLDVYLTENVCPMCGNGEEVYCANITHNLTEMADAAGIYEIVWLPEEAGIESASQLIKPLEKAIADMKADPGKYEKHNAPNGWGLYKNFVPWLEEYLQACKDHPDASVTVLR